MVLDIFLILFAILLISSVVRGAPFVPTHQRRVARMVELSGAGPGQKAVDLGSGDGRIVIAMARVGAIAHGYEINPFLVWWARYKIRREKLSDRAFVHLGSFWGKDLAEFDVVTVFGTTHIMRGLERKLKKELKPNARVISYVFTFPSWEYAQKESAIFVYKQAQI